MLEKIILHVDMDAFFASVEVMDNPSLRGKPVIVGGTSQRGVVATCSYEARKFGVRSAMPIFQAVKKCPLGIFLPTRHSRYSEVSRNIFNIFYDITPFVEPLSIDEAYLDITGIDKDPIKVAMEIKDRVKKEMGLTLSVGLSYNKFLAKLASDWNKPDGLKIITEDMIPKVLFPLPISKVYGLGEKSVKRLNNIGIFTVEDLYNLPKDIFIQYFGKSGIEIYDRIRGIDKREVTILRERKSIGREITLKADTEDKSELKKYLNYFSESIEKSLRKKNMRGKTVTVKIKTAAFAGHTKSKTLSSYIASKDEIYKESCEILEDLDLLEKIRLIGVSVSSLKENVEEQMTFFADAYNKVQGER